MGRLVLAIIGLILTFWLLIFTEVTVLQVGLIFGIALADFIGDRLE